MRKGGIANASPALVHDFKEKSERNAVPRVRDGKGATCEYLQVRDTLVIPPSHRQTVCYNLGNNSERANLVWKDHYRQVGQCLPIVSVPVG